MEASHTWLSRIRSGVGKSLYLRQRFAAPPCVPAPFNRRGSAWEEGGKRRRRGKRNRICHFLEASVCTCAPIPPLIPAAARAPHISACLRQTNACDRGRASSLAVAVGTADRFHRLLLYRAPGRMPGAHRSRRLRTAGASVVPVRRWRGRRGRHSDHLRRPVERCAPRLPVANAGTAGVSCVRAGGTWAGQRAFRMSRTTTGGTAGGGRDDVFIESDGVDAGELERLQHSSNRHGDPTTGFPAHHICAVIWPPHTRPHHPCGARRPIEPPVPMQPCAGSDPA